MFTGFKPLLLSGFTGNTFCPLSGFIGFIFCPLSGFTGFIFCPLSGFIGFIFCPGLKGCRGLGFDCCPLGKLIGCGWVGPAFIRALVSACIPGPKFLVFYLTINYFFILTESKYTKQYLA